MKLFLLSLFVVSAMADGGAKVKLEDIERDNLLNERRSQHKDNLVAQQSQHLRPPSVLSQNQYAHQERADEEAAYVQAPGAQGYEAPDNHIEYVQHQQVPSYVRQEYISGPAQSQPTFVPQVHEAEQTYTVPSRQSLNYPIIGGSVPVALTPQPQYVYVQAAPAQQQFQHRHQFIQPEFVQPPQYVGLTYPKLPAQYLQNIHQIPVPRPQITTHSEVTSHVESHTERPTITISSTVSPLPSRHQQSVAPIEYVPSLKVQPSLHQQLPHHHQAYYFSGPTQYQYASQHNSLNFPPQPVYNFDFFNHQHASSLLDSYIPSSVVIARQHAQAAKVHNFQYSHGAAAAPSGYNTISFSAPHPPHFGGAHYKRSSAVAGKGHSKP